MKRFAAILTLALLLTGAAAAQDSMASYRSMLENSGASAGDYGALIGPEILSVEPYPLMPRPGDAVKIRATVMSYSSMAPFKIVKTQLSFSINGGPAQTVEMKVEDAELGIYSHTLPKLKDGDDVTWSVRAVDDWGNAAIEIAPGTENLLLLQDLPDKDVAPPVDIDTIDAAWDGEKLRLCMTQKAKIEKTVNREIAVYGIAMFDRDVRYKTDMTDGVELGTGMIAAYANLMGSTVKDIVKIPQLLEAATGKKVGRGAEFEKKDNRMCFTFAPSLIREDYANGLKLAGATITGDLATMSLKPRDTTRVVMLYPVRHSLKVFEIK